MNRHLAFVAISKLLSTKTFNCLHICIKNQTDTPGGSDPIALLLVRVLNKITYILPRPQQHFLNNFVIYLPFCTKPIHSIQNQDHLLHSPFTTLQPE
jgi:hypothetical protein